MARFRKNDFFKWTHLLALKKIPCNMAAARDSSSFYLNGNTLHKLKN